MIADLLREVAAVLRHKKIKGKDGEETPILAKLKAREFTPENLETIAMAVEAKTK